MTALGSGRLEREVLAGGKLKGGIFRSHIAWLQERHPDRANDLWTELPPEATETLSGVILASSWYPFEWLIRIDRAILAMFGDDDPDLLPELGSYSAKINLSTTYRVFDRYTNHEFFLNSALLHRQFQDFGSVRYEKTGDTSGVMIHTEYPCFSRVFCESAVGYYEQCVANHGGKSPQVRETECQCFGDPSCSFDIRWT
ncbi:MAG: hypothetical protein WBX15_13105 [Thermoanaerobaculia bacterium]